MQIKPSASAFFSARLLTSARFFFPSRFFTPLSIALLLSASPLLSLPALAHHSFAIFDFQTRIPFDGTVATLKFRNPHIEMTLKTVGADGKEQIVHFIEGAPANMLVRSGLRPDMIAPGTHIIATGSPLIEDNSRFFLRAIRLDSGEEFSP